ncbi:MAG: pilus assembly protein TadG-related protein [Actinomycetota bacterium]
MTGPAERGSVSVMFAVLGFAIFAALALIVDGGRQLGALTEAQDLADNAARYGSQEVDLDIWRTTGVPELDPVRAEAKVFEFLDAKLASGRVDPPIVTVDGVTLTVELTVNRSQFFFPTRPATAVESAQALDGVTEADP